MYVYIQNTAHRTLYTRFFFVKTRLIRENSGQNESVWNRWLLHRISARSRARANQARYSYLLKVELDFEATQTE